MKRYFKCLTVFVLCLVLAVGNFVTVKASTLSITFNGKTYDYEGKQLSAECGGEKFNLKKSPGILEEGYALLPYNVFGHSSLGVKTSYNQSKKTITFQYAKQKVVVTLNSDKMTVNGKTKKLPIVPRSVRYNATKVTKLLVPSRSIAEELGLDYSYNSKKALVSIKQKKGMNVTVPEGTQTTGKTLSLTYNGKTYEYDNKQLSAICGGETFNLTKCPGILEDGYGLLPYNVFGHSSLGVTTSYNKTKKTITFTYGKQKVVVTLNSKTMLVNNKKVTLPVEPKQVRYNNTKVTKLLVPSRSVAENLGLYYYYDSKNATISISQKEVNDSDNSQKEENSSSSSVGRKVEYNGQVVVITKKDVTVKTEGVKVKTAMPGVILNNVAMLPAYNTFYNNSHIGTTYQYNSSKKQAVITGNGNKLILTMGKKQALLNGKSISLAEPAWLMKNFENNKTYCMVPGQSVAEALGYQYTWDNAGVVSMITIKDDDSSNTTEEPTTDTEKPSTDTEAPSTDSDSTEDSDDNEGDFSNYEVLIPRPSTSIAWKDCEVLDNYQNRQFVITIPGDYTSFYNKNKISYNTVAVEEISVSENELGDTEIVIKTPSIQGISCKETKDSWQIAIKNPTEIYDQILVLDAGHGGSDSGSLSTKYGVIEKNVALDIIERTQKYFEDDSNIKVYYTRLTDAQSGITYGSGVSSTTVSVVNRANFANEIGADLFISVHCNSATNTSARGTEVLYSSKNTNTSASGLTSKQFADMAFPHLLDAVGSLKRSVKDSPNLIVCKNTNMPAILLETAFLSNKEDADLLKDTDVLEQIAKAIYDTVQEVFEEYPTLR